MVHSTGGGELVGGGDEEKVQKDDEPRTDNTNRGQMFESFRQLMGLGFELLRVSFLPTCRAKSSFKIPLPSIKLFFYIRRFLFR